MHVAASKSWATTAFPSAESSTARTRKCRILIVEAQPITRYGLARLIDAEPDMVQAGQASNRASALELFEKCDPDVVIIDLLLGPDDGLELATQLVRRRANLPLLIFSMMDEALFAERALRAGARGYLMKSAGSDVILAAIRGVFNGDICVSKAISDAALRRLAGLGAGEANCPLAELTARELQIFLLLGRGHDAHQIAEQLFISVHTVQAHREHIKGKLNFERSKDLAHYASQFVTSMS